MNISPALKRLARIQLGQVANLLGVNRYNLARLVGRRGGLSQQQTSLLHQLRADNLLAPTPFRTTEHWKEVSRLFEREFYLEGIRDVETQFFNRSFSGFPASDPRLHGYLVYTYFSLLREIDRHGLLGRIPATCPVRPGFAYEIDGCKVSLDLLFSIDEFYSLLEVKPDLISEPIVVADIGAGWGRLGYVIKKANPRAAYVVFDLPEVLLISLSYLPTLLPEVTFQTYLEARNLMELDRETLIKGGLWFLGSQDLLKIIDGALDIVVNIASFQEMTSGQIAEYFELIGRKGAGGILYLKQLWSGMTHGHHFTEIRGYDLYPFPPRWEQVILRNTRFSQHFFETAFRL